MHVPSVGPGDGPRQRGRCAEAAPGREAPDANRNDHGCECEDAQIEDFDNGCLAQSRIHGSRCKESNHRALYGERPRGRQQLPAVALPFPDDCEQTCPHDANRNEQDRRRSHRRCNPALPPSLCRPNRPSHEHCDHQTTGVAAHATFSRRQGSSCFEHAVSASPPDQTNSPSRTPAPASTSRCCLISTVDATTQIPTAVAWTLLRNPWRAASRQVKTVRLAWSLGRELPGVSMLWTAASNCS